MRSFISGVALASLLVALCFASLQAQTPQPLRPGATISGRVTVKGKGVAGLTVGLRKSGTSGTEILPRALTDIDGNNEMSNSDLLHLANAIEPRAKLKRIAAAAKTEIELRPCQNMTGLTLSPH